MSGLYLIVEKGGNRMLHLRVFHGARKTTTSKTLEVAAVDFPDVAFFSEADGLAEIEVLKGQLPHFKFELCRREEFETKYTEGHLAGFVFRK